MQHIQYVWGGVEKFGLLKLVS